MRVSGEATLAAAPDAVRALLADPEALAAALPNVDELSVDVDGESGVDVGARAFSATIRPALALGEIPIRMRWTPQSATTDELTWSVEGHGDEHAVRCAVALRLAPSAEPGGTRLTWTLDCAFTGVLRSVGQRTLEAIVRHQANAVVRGLAEAAVTAP